VAAERCEINTVVMAGGFATRVFPSFHEEVASRDAVDMTRRSSPQARIFARRRFICALLRLIVPPEKIERRSDDQTLIPTMSCGSAVQSADV
jgi:hypothetical protein